MNTERKIVDAELPEGWRMVRLDAVAEAIMGQSPPGSTVIELDDDSDATTGLPFIQGNAEFGRMFPTPSKWCVKPLKVAETDDVLFSVRAPVGDVNRADRSLGIGRGVAAIRFTGAEPDFGWHAITHSRNRFERLAQGSTFEAIGGPEIRALPILLPPLPEQRAIADVLDSIDEAIERTEAVIAATETLRDSLLHELLTRGVPGCHTEWKDVPGIGTIPADWEVVRLDRVATVERGKFAHRPRNEPRFYGGDIPFIQTSDVVRSVGVVRSHSQTLNQLGLSISRLFPAGTVVITIAANIGETAITGYPVAFPDSLVGITPTDIDGRFLEYYLRTQKATLERFAPESAQKNINLEDLRPMLVPVPSLDEQTMIVENLDAVQNDIDSQQVLLADTQTFKVSAAQELLSGREAAWKVR